MKRRGFLLAAIAGPLSADDAQDVWDLFTEMAAALSDAKSAEFLKPFVPAMPGYETLRMEIEALLLSYEVHSSIELLSDEGDSVSRSVELDWLLQVVEKQDTAGVTRRRETVHCRLVKQKKKWRISALEPLQFFAPPRQ